jgi:CRP-like cAMP-binding protein
VLEHLARRLESVSFPAGTEIVREGDAGDRFYIVSSGRLEVSTAGGPLRSLGPGDWFGEIALLRDVPRTATVAAASDVTLFSLERDEFVGAVTGHPASVEAADAVVAARLGAVRPGMASL